MKTPGRIALLAAAVCTSACTDAATPPEVPVALAGLDSVVLEEADSQSLTAHFLDAAGDTIGQARAAWIVDDTSLASVSNTGLLRFRHPGRTRVTALAAGFTRDVGVTAVVRFAELADPGCGTTTHGDTYCLSAREPTATRVARGLHGVVRELYHVCGLDAGGRAWCRGTGGWGELGNPAVTSTDTFVIAAAGHRFRALSVAWGSTCGLGDDGVISCWGLGPLGRGDTTNGWTVAPVAGAQRYTSVSLGAHTACGATVDGRVQCWGNNTNGMLGQPAESLAWSDTPSDVPGVTGATVVRATGGYACAVTGAGAVYCWGRNNYLQLGRACGDGPCGPGRVDGLPPVADVTVEGSWVGHTCALARDGTIWCWGVGSGLGDGTSAARATPRPVSVLGSFVGLSHYAGSQGWYATCALRNDGVQLCWGGDYPSTPGRLPLQP